MWTAVAWADHGVRGLTSLTGLAGGSWLEELLKRGCIKACWCPLTLILRNAVGIAALLLSAIPQAFEDRDSL